MINAKQISSCKCCDFFFVSMDGMECGHPYWGDKGAYDGMIVSHDVKIPDKCPLRIEPLTITYELVEEQ